MKKVFTGIKDADRKQFLDKALGNGFPESSINLITGKTGTCKSIFVNQILSYNATKEKLKCLYITLEQPLWKLERQMQAFNFKVNKNKNFKAIYFDLYEEELAKSKRIIKLKHEIKRISKIKVFDPEKLQKIEAKKQKLTDKINAIRREMPPLMYRINSIIEKEAYDIIAIDSLDALADEMADETIIEHPYTVNEILDMPAMIQKTQESITRKQLRGIISALDNATMTSFLIAEQPENSNALTRLEITDFLVDNVIVMYYVGVGTTKFRSLKIRKARESNHYKDFILFDLNKEGIYTFQNALKRHLK